MRSTIVPAQVTTVEDRIIGNLGLTQVVLLVSPLLYYYAIKFFIPPFGHYNLIKVVVMILLSALSGGAAIRIKGTLVIFRLIAVIGYCLRPRYFVFDKHSSYARTRYLGPEALIAPTDTLVMEPVRERLQLSTAQVAQLEQMLHNPAAQFSYDLTKGGLRVRLTEIKEES